MGPCLDLLIATPCDVHGGVQLEWFARHEVVDGCVDIVVCVLDLGLAVNETQTPVRNLQVIERQPRCCARLRRSAGRRLRRCPS
jgi:hypothetical protein